MALSAGACLGPYEILARIGAGGMGEVYRARDPRTGRDVAIKISAERFSDRFSREVHAVAALNHPNICHLYDVGPDYLVMELVEGPTLAETIKQGPVPLEEALGIAKQIAEALEAAHEKGIVHRDLKPGNIKIRPDGTVKVLDFGLAKATNPPVSTSPEDSPTISMAATQAGVILGTAAYMSPEQARGKVVDKRTDIWAFGVVLYEMLTGKQLFHGETVSDTLAAVLTKEPDWEQVPPKVRRLLQRCLEKDPAKRLRDFSGVALLLEDGPVESRHPRPIPWAIAAAMALIAFIGLFGWWRAVQPAALKPLVRLDVDLGPEISLRPLRGNTSSVIISPDGTRLIYVASVTGGQPKLFTRKLDQPNATELAGTEGAIFPFFSPDGQWVGFATDSSLNKVSVEGAAVVPLSGQHTLAASWSEDGNIIADKFGHGLVLIPSGGGAPTPVTELASGEFFHWYPQILPGGKAVLFTAYGNSFFDVDKASIEVVSLEDRRRKTLVRGGTSPHYVAASNGADYLVYSNKGTLFAIPFDLKRWETRGTAVPVLDGVAYEPTLGGAHFDISHTGTLVYRKGSGSGSGMTTVQWLDAAGKRTPLLAKPGDYNDLGFSPDGKRLVLVDMSGNAWVYDLQRDAMTRLIFGAELSLAPIWSPDGRYLAFDVSGKGIYWIRADGAGQPQPLTQSKNRQVATSFAPDGKRLAYSEYVGNPQIWTIPLEDQGGQLKAGKPEQFLKSQYSDSFPMFSPDGHWLAYNSDESGKFEVYVRPFPPAAGRGGKWQISISGGRYPVWSPNGRELTFATGDKLVAVSYSANGDSFVAEKPRVWIAKLGAYRSLDLAPDGKRLAIIMPVETEESPKLEHEVTFLFNFADELRRRIPAGR